ncbi:MAG: DUF2807 domain-containing protein [Bacteroidota bacterium]
MKTYKLLTATFIAMTFLMAPNAKAQKASGNVITREIQIGDFTGINVSDPIDYIVSQSDKNLIKIETDDNLFDNIKTEVKGGILYIDANSALGATKLNVYILVKDLKNIKITAAASIRSDNTLKSSNLQIDASGAADVKLDVEVTNLVTDASGAASVKLSGTAQNHNIRASGASDLKAENLKTKTAQVKISGASNAKIDVKDKVTASVSGAADLKYVNKPALIDLIESGDVIPNMDSLRDETNLIMEHSEQEMEKAEAEMDRLEEKQDSIEHFMNQSESNMDKYCRKSNYDFWKGSSDNVWIHWTGINIGINGFTDAQYKFKVPAAYNYLAPDYGKSWFVDLNFIQFSAPIIKKYWHLVTGMGFTINNYVIQKDYILKPNTEFLEGSIDTSVTYKKNKLTDVFFQVPLLFQFDTKKIKGSATFHVLLGVVGGVRVTSYTKQKYEFNESKNITRTFDDFNLSHFRWSALLKLGYGPVNVFATYQLNQMFKPHDGPQLYPFAIGITVMGF